MFKRNPGRFTHKIVLMRPSAPVRDELGGIGKITYTDAYTVMAMVEDKDQSRRQVIGDYVTVDTKYFVTRDLSMMIPYLDVNWRLKYNGFVYTINKVELMNESKPYFMQLTATAINSGGVVNDL